MSQATSNDTEGESPSAHFKTLRTLVPYLWPRGRGGLKLRVVIAMAFLAAAKLTTVYVPFLYKAAVDALTVESTAIIVVPLFVIIGYGLARVMAQAFGELRDAVFAKVGQHALRSIALNTFHHLHRLSLRFHLERQTGGLSRSIERGTKGIDFLLRFMLFNVLPTLLEIGLVCGILLYRYNFWFAAITFFSVGGYITFTLLFTEWRIKYRREMNRSESEANTKAIDSLLNFETVKYFGNEAHEETRFDQSLERYQKAAVKSQITLSGLNIGQGFIIAAGLIGVMLLAAFGVRDGTMTIGDFVLVNTFLIQLYLPLGFLGFVYREIKQSLVDMEAMFKLLSVEKEVEDRDDATVLEAARGEIEFDRVGFNYEADRQILRDVSFTVPAGKTVAIVGPSGAGKSTISRLLFRFYDVTEGAIRIDGQDIRRVTQDSCRSAIGIVPQDTVLFNDTIGYNIRYGRPEATDAEVEEAARLAHIHEFVSGLPLGYHTIVGERGLKLSGGEKQRVAIARTILKKPSILLFDEATSALDSHTEKEIQASIREVSVDRTTLIIAHRLSTIIDADEILVLEDGRVVERGSHAVLLSQDGLYADMWRRQQQAAEYQERLAEALGPLEPEFDDVSRPIPVEAPAE
tara:strand:- start:4033 stop:5925 length:1893 start_codon:yes stop_codon:yes gene_type:complete